MGISAQAVKELREKTSCGMMDCKKALTEANGDMEKAIELLREKGLAAAVKKAGRIASEGMVFAKYCEQCGVGVVIEVNAETDFVAKNADFKKFVETAANTVIKENPKDVETLLACKAADSELTVEGLLQEKILTIGENMKVRRFERYEGTVATYIHGDGRIGVMVKFNTDVADKPEFAAYAKDVAMQVAAANPIYCHKTDVPEDVVAKEKEIYTAQAINEGKPANIAEKMVVGRINKYYQEVCLVEQEFIKNNDLSVKKHTDEVAKQLGGKIEIVSFVRFEKGEGLEKRVDNFAEEVTSMMK